MDRKKSKIIIITSIKSGIGKSINCLAFAFLLSRIKNLIIDMDIQVSATSYYQKKYIRAV
ncbi:hypothetical protein O5404_04455 (plasmid) [Borrelia miyamotoi]|uniref:CobQ/CobB/MinD/ParA nucleotide binding domain-containing protein n=1 Tax=Borrelia miyamotoi TaxID=47466 RepID=A0AAX3JMY3_9SPIR|nr:hypothetical protein [Borrelia miyamotoi]WAZ72281.1 hypothetical protein O5404_04455 [Borrelia miyamotoi]WVI05277.1 hypothetical protein F9Y91_00145 [Borrelia miyamotoi]